MNSVLYYLMLFLLILMTINNFKKIRQSGNEKKFVEVYSKILKDAPDAKQTLEDYIKEEKKEYLLIKAKMLKIYMALLTPSEDVSSLVKELSLKPLFYLNGRYDSKWVVRNADSFIWIMLIMARANKVGNKYVVEKIYALLNEHENVLNKSLDYYIIKGEYACLVSNDEKDIEFLKNYMNGEYPPLTFEKRLTTLYKRETTCFLTYKGIEVDEFWKEDLSRFAKTMIGRSLMIALDLYEKYPPMLSEEDAIKADEEVK